MSFSKLKTSICFAIMLIMICSTSFAIFFSFNEDMTPRDQKHTGIDKLSSSEQQALENWISDLLENKLNRRNSFAITENEHDGGVIHLDNGTSYEIPVKYLQTTQLWLRGSRVKVKPSGNFLSPYFLTNLNSNNTVQAKLIPNDD